MQGRLSVDSLKSAGNGPIHSPVRNPIKHKTNQNKKGKQTKKTHQNTTTPKQTRHREVGPLPALRNEMHDDILCVIMSMARKRSKTKTTRKNTGGPYKRVKEATKLNAETGDPPSQDPRDHREQPFRHNIHPGTSKQTTTTPCRNESGEKRKKVRQEVRHDLK